jgi:hypothetical protein
VVIAVLPEPDELEPELPEVVEPEEFEPEELEPEEFEPEELGEPDAAELELVDPDDVDAAVLLVLWASAGSCPDTSWTKTTPQIKTNIEAAAARARFRINATRRRRAFSRAATPPGTLAGRSSLGADVGVGVS